MDEIAKNWWQLMQNSDNRAEIAVHVCRATMHWEHIVNSEAHLPSLDALAAIPIEI